MELAGEQCWACRSSIPRKWLLASVENLWVKAHNPKLGYKLINCTLSVYQTQWLLSWVFYRDLCTGSTCYAVVTVKYLKARSQRIPSGQKRSYISVHILRVGNRTRELHSLLKSINELSDRGVFQREISILRDPLWICYMSSLFYITWRDVEAYFYVTSNGQFQRSVGCRLSVINVHFFSVGVINVHVTVGCGVSTFVWHLFINK